MPSPSLGLGTVARMLGSQPAVVVSTMTIVLTAVFGLSALPRSLEGASREDLHETVTEANPLLRNISVTQLFRHNTGPEGDRMGPARNRGDAFAKSEMTTTVEEVVDGMDMVVESAQFSVRQLPGSTEPSGRSRDPTFIRLRHQDSAADHLEMVKGRHPAPTGEIEPVFDCPDPEEECPPTQVPVVEVALSEPTAEEMQLEVGDRMLLVPDGEDLLWVGLTGQEIGSIRYVLSVVGIFELADPGQELWERDRILYEPRVVFETLDFQFVYATALMSPDDYGRMARVITPVVGPPWWRYEWRFLVDSDAVSRSELDTLREDLASWRLAHSTTRAGSTAFLVSTRLPELINFHLAQRSQTLKVMSLSIAGIFAVVTSAVLALGVLITERQRAQIILARGRGASAPQVATTRLYQATFMTVPATAVAYAMASAMFPDSSRLTPYLVSVMLAIAAIVALVASVLGLARQQVGSLRDVDVWPRPQSPKRVVLEALAVILAASSVVLVRRREPATTVELDWLLIATPVLIGAVVGAATIRLAGPVAVALAWLFSKKRDVVSFVGLRRVAQQPVPARVPLAVLVVCLAAASFSIMLHRSITSGQVVGSFQIVGADYSISADSPDIPLPGELTPSDMGSDQVAFATVFPDAWATLRGRRTSAILVAVDSGSHERIFSGTPGALPLGKLRDSSDQDTVAGIAPTAWPTTVGEVVTVELGDHEVQVEIVAVRDRHPGVDPVRPFIVVDRDALQAVTGQPIAPTIAYLRGPRSLGEELEKSIAERFPGMSVVSRYDELDAVAGDPLVRWAVRGLAAAWVLAATVGVIGMLASLALGAARRRRDFGYLKTMGLVDRQALWMTLIEQVPGVVLAGSLGLLTGVATAIAIRPAIDLTFFTGGVISTPLVIDWSLLAGLLGLSVGLLLIAGAIFVVVNRHQDLGRAVRIGDE
jgi:putative ABC transport system permease protein